MNDHEGSTIVGRDQCPRCKSRGADNSKDNLAIYQDGHEWCYACQYYKPAKIEKRIGRLLEPIEATNRSTNIISLPDDASASMPAEILSRLMAWGLSIEQITRNKFMWSKELDRLIMPVYDGFGQLLMYQARSFNPVAQKYLTYGKSSDILHVIPTLGTNSDKRVVILTEDLVSAIRVSEYKPAMPIWGSDIPLKTIQRLATQFEVVGVWLDPDMKIKAVKDVIRISQYIPAFFIESGLDPKFYNLERIREHIDIAGYHMLFKDQLARRVEKEVNPVIRFEDANPCVADADHTCPGRLNGCCQDA